MEQVDWQLRRIRNVAFDKWYNGSGYSGSRLVWFMVWAETL